MKKIKVLAFDLIWCLIGSFIYAFAVSIFIAPNEISPGGFTGIATALSFALNIPIGILYFLLNIPVLVLGFIKFGSFFIVKTAMASFFVSFALTVTDLLNFTFKNDQILGAVFGGVFMGLGLSIVIRRGATTGGVDIIAKLINRKWRHLTIGRLVLLMDAIVVTFSVMVYKNIESALYSIVSIYVTSYIMDIMLYGGDKGKLIYIISDRAKEICLDINNQLKRGVTCISAKGGYTGKEKTVLLCTVRRHEVAAVYSVAFKNDKNAFIIVGEVGEIIGEGFKGLGFDNNHY